MRTALAGNLISMLMLQLIMDSVNILLRDTDVMANVQLILTLMVFVIYLINVLKMPQIHVQVVLTAEMLNQDCLQRVTMIRLLQWTIIHASMQHLDMIVMVFVQLTLMLTVFAMSTILVQMMLQTHVLVVPISLHVTTVNQLRLTMVHVSTHYQDRTVKETLLVHLLLHQKK